MADRKKNPTFQAILLSLFGFVLLWAVVTDAWGYSSWGVIGCLLLKRGKTIWNPIIAHTVYDVVVVLFVG